MEGHDDKYKSLLDKRHHVEDRADFEYTHAPELQKEYEWVGSYPTICIQTVFSNLAKKSVPNGRSHFFWIAHFFCKVPNNAKEW